MGSGTEGTGQEAQYGSHLGPSLTVCDTDSVIYPLRSAISHLLNENNNNYRHPSQVL